jgi:rod shape-determining protein MreD
MRRVLIISFLTFFFFLLEFIIFHLIGGWAKPQLLILLVIFFNLYLGIRYGLYAAVLAGVITDSFTTNVFGLNVVAFIICAYMTTLLRKYIYYRGSRMSRLILVFFICLVDFTVRLILHAMLGVIDVAGAIVVILLPALAMTLLCTSTVFHQLRLCVSRLFV